MKLSDNIEIGVANGSLSDTTIQIDIYPSISQWVQSQNDPGVLISCDPLKVNTTNVPRLSITAHKECFVKTFNPGSKITFVVQSTSDGSIPSGTIIMFYPGTLQQEETLASKIPSGYAICDGTQGTPDLRGRFIRMVDQVNNTWEEVGAKNNSDLSTGDSGRYDSIIIHDYNLPTHVHTTGDMSVNYAYGSKTIAIPTIETTSVRVEPSSTGSSYVSSVSVGSVAETITWDHTHTLFQSINNTFDNKINIEPEAYALVFIMKL